MSPVTSPAPAACADAPTAAWPGCRSPDDDRVDLYFASITVLEGCNTGPRRLISARAVCCWWAAEWWVSSRAPRRAASRPALPRIRRHSSICGGGRTSTFRPAPRRTADGWWQTGARCATSGLAHQIGTSALTAYVSLTAASVTTSSRPWRAGGANTAIRCSCAKWSCAATTKKAALWDGKPKAIPENCEAVFEGRRSCHIAEGGKLVRLVGPVSATTCSSARSPTGARHRTSNAICPARGRIKMAAGLLKGNLGFTCPGPWTSWRPARTRQKHGLRNRIARGPGAPRSRRHRLLRSLRNKPQAQGPRLRATRGEATTQHRRHWTFAPDKGAPRARAANADRPLSGRRSTSTCAWSTRATSRSPMCRPTSTASAPRTRSSSRASR